MGCTLVKLTLVALLGAKARPNIILLMPDQWRWDWDGLPHPHVGRMPPLNLPNIERLRSLGTSFPRGAVVPSPLCAPSRACMASLREYDRAGVATNSANDFKASEIPTYFSALQRAGYHTMTTGKDDLTKATHLGHTLGYDTHNASNTYLAHALGFTDSIRFEGKGGVIETYPKPHEPFGYFLDSQMVRLPNGTEISAFVAHRTCLVRHDPNICDRLTYPQRLYEDDWTAAQAVNLLKRAPSDKPWFLWVSFPGPHPPFAVTASMGHEIAGRSWPHPVDSYKQVPRCYRDKHEPSNARTRCNYGAEIENLDRLFGVVLDAVKARGNAVENDTVACFFSDHGEMLNDHDDIDKSKPWQGALNVPLVCAGPGIRSNMTLDVPVATVDIGATMLDIAGAWRYRDANMTAKSFRGLLEGAGRQTRNRTVVHSGLQKHDFGSSEEISLLEEGEEGEEGEDGEEGEEIKDGIDSKDGAAARAFSFRLAVSELDGPPISTYKFVCCKGRCPGAPSPVGRPGTDGYTRLLFDTIADPFDMHDLMHRLPHVAEALRSELPVEHGFNCSSMQTSSTASAQSMAALAPSPPPPHIMAAAQAPPTLRVDFSGAHISNSLWLLQSKQLRMHHDGVWHELRHTLPQTHLGADALGRYSETKVLWHGTTTKASISTSIRSYLDDPGLAVCVTTFLTAVANTTVNVQKEQPIFGFPSFRLGHAAMPSLGFALWQGLWPVPQIDMNLSSTDAFGAFPRRDGPVLFTSAQRESLLVGPVDDLLNTVFRAPSQSAVDASLAYGPSGRVSHIHAGYSFSIAMITGNGPTDAIRRYGDVLRRARGIDAHKFERLADATVSKISYWTDNGAFYFLPNVSQQLLLTELDSLAAQHVKIGSLQLDGWWMDNPDVSPNPRYFPDWAAFRRGLGSRGLLLYKSYFREDDRLFTDRCKVQSSKAGWWYPCAQTALQVYTQLFTEGKALGMTAYETDFISDHMLATPGLQNTTVGLPLTFISMAEAGRRQHIPMQWCMPTAATVLFAVNLSAVSNARASPDYAVEGPEAATINATWSNTYEIGAAGLLFWAVGLPPSKDLTWTSPQQPDAPKSALGHPNVELDTALAVLSTGPVGFGDGPGLTNVSLVNRTCRSDGVILKPSKTVTAIDSTFVPSYTSPKPYLGFLPLTADGDCTAKRPCSPSVYQTHSDVSGHIWHQLIAMHLGPFRPTASDFYPALGSRPFVVRESRWTSCSNHSLAYAAGCVLKADLGSLGPLPDISTGAHRLDSNGAVAWKLFTLSPMLANGWVLLGELDKFVPVSPMRFSAVSTHGACLSFTAFVAEGEAIHVDAISPSGRYRTQTLQAQMAGPLDGWFC